MEQQIIVIAQQKGGVGKTTLTAHLAVALSQRKKRVAVIDIDPQGSLTQWYSLREARFGTEYTGFTFENVPGWRASTMINRLKNDHDLILIDNPPHAETEMRNAIRAANLVLVPVQPSPTDIWATERTLEMAHQEGVPAYTVLNRCPNNSKLAKFCSKQLPNLMKHILGNRVAFANCMLDGRTVTETEPNGPAAKEIKALTEELMKIMTKKKVLEEA